MQNTTRYSLAAPDFGAPTSPAPRNISAWSLRAWPALLWQAGRSTGLHFRHSRTSITTPAAGRFAGHKAVGLTGQTLWCCEVHAGEVGVAWDWIQITHGVVAMADPMSIVSNLRLVGDAGEVLTTLGAARFLNEMVHALPWQREVALAIRASVQ